MKRKIIYGLLFISATSSAATMPTGFYLKLGVGQTYGYNEQLSIIDAYSGGNDKYSDDLNYGDSSSYEFSAGYSVNSWLSTELTLN